MAAILVTRQRRGSNNVVVNPGTRRRHPAARASAAERLHLARRRERIERPLHGALARAQRQRQRRARPRLAVGEEGEHRARAPRLRPAAPARRPRGRGAASSAKPSLRRADAGKRPQQRAQPSDFDAQPRAMRFVGVLPAERARDEHVPRHIAGPRFAERAREREQHRSRRERDHACRACAHDVTAGVDDERLRRQQRFDVLEQERPLLAAARSVAPPACSACAMRSRLPRSAPEYVRRARHARLERARRAPPSSGCAASRCPRRRAREPSAARAGKRRRIELGERALGFVEPSDQQQAPDVEIPRMRRVHAIAVRFERRPRRVERLRRPAEVARDRARFRPRRRRTVRARRAPSRRRRAPRVAASVFARTKSPSCAIAMPRSASAGAIVAQRDTFQRAERITGRERTRRGRDQRVHRESRHTCHSHRLAARRSIYRTTRHRATVSATDERHVA